MVECAAITFRHTGYYIIVMILISRLISQPTCRLLFDAWLMAVLMKGFTQGWYMTEPSNAPTLPLGVEER